MWGRAASALHEQLRNPPVYKGFAGIGDSAVVDTINQIAAKHSRGQGSKVDGCIC
jgi:hypothetical protein